jgi:hypothetical protein
MSIEEIQKAIAEQGKVIDKVTDELKSVPKDAKARPEKILQLVREELASVEKELAKYSEYKF